MDQDVDPYAVLGVAPTATAADITRAFRERVRALHPDSRAASAQATEDDDLQLRLVLTAYVQLRRSRTETGDRDGEERMRPTQTHQSAWFAAGQVYRVE